MDTECGPHDEEQDTSFKATTPFSERYEARDHIISPNAFGNP